MAHSFVNLLTHMIFGTKRRKPYIAEEIRSDLFAYMGGIIRELGGKPIIVNGMIDHVHLLVGMPATRTPADVLRVLKTNSSRWVHERWPHRTEFAWQSGYGLFSVSESNRQKLFQYIQTQEEHHKTVSFEEE
ncbi:MAG: IS200/IS605 family transposase [Candidatus Hydrogenedentes bacterium]|nr:IS200/IS605 family transposase [Candidatus Hydrogenedentota bacterium]